MPGDQEGLVPRMRENDRENTAALAGRVLRDWGGAHVVALAYIGDRLGGRLLYGTSTMHCMTVSLAHGGEGLGSVVGEEKARELGAGAGFTQFTRLPVEHVFHQLFLLRK